MRDVSAASAKGGQAASAVGLIVQLLAIAILLVLGLWTGSQSILVGTRHAIGGVLVWLVLILVFTQRKRAELKDREIEELKRARAADPSLAIFEVEEGSVERRRLEWMYRWLYPVATILLAAYHIVAALFVKWSWSLGEAPASEVWKTVESPGPVMAFLAGLGFVCFLYSRYAAGMAHQDPWRLTRAGATYLAGNALTCLALVVAVGLQAYDIPYGEPIVAHGIRILLLVLGVEYLIALILNYYRPRIAGEEPRPAFDSRLLEIVSEPGSVARSIAEAINYQFGFEVTSTWFAQLLKRSFLPLMLLGAVSLLLLSSVVIIDEGEQAYVERFGRLKQSPQAPLGPGLHFKLPWPIDQVYRAPVKEIRLVRVGATPKESPYDEQGRLKPVLWTEQHDYTYEMMTVVAAPPQTQLELEATLPSEEEEGRERPVLDKSVAVNLLNISVPIEYRIKDLYDFLYHYAEPDQVLEAVAFRAFSDYAASVDSRTLMGPGRGDFAETFRRRVQSAVDGLDDDAERPDVGVEITFLGLQSAHPPARQEVAKAYQKVIEAEIQKNAAIERAEGEARRLLTEIAGSVARAEALASAIDELKTLSNDPEVSPETLAEAQARVNDLMLGNAAKNIAPMSGEASRMIAVAQARRTEAITEAETKARLFEAEVVAYEASPLLYKTRQYLEVLKRSLETVRKFVVTRDEMRKALIPIIDREKPETLTLGGSD